jgi:ribosome-binding protein aMBF1 (putative translation factor)
MDVKLLELVKCDKCNRKMTERTLKYAHEEKCPAIHPHKPRVRKPKIQPEEPPEPTYEEAPAPQPLKRDTASIIREKINQKKEQYKALAANAF